MSGPSDEGDELVRLARATAPIAPDAGFTDAVMALVERGQAAAAARPADLAEGIAASARWALGLAACAAAAAALLSLRVASELDEQAVAGVDVVEVSE